MEIQKVVSQNESFVADINPKKDTANKENLQKIKLLKILEILHQETDENNQIGTNKMIEKLKVCGIKCTRKTLYADMQLLQDFGYGVNWTRGVSNSYYVNTDSKFDVPELRILIDAVQAASFVTEKKTNELTNKIAHLLGKKSAEVLKSNVVSFNTIKSKNESIFYNVSEIAYAISQGKKIEFVYFDMDIKKQRVYRRNGEKYVVSPYATIFSDDKYYLLCDDPRHERQISHYRLDRMRQVNVLDEKVDRLAEAKKVDIKKYKKQLFGMFGGKEESVRFMANNCLIDVVIDKFGEGVKLYPTGQDHFVFTTDVQVSVAFLAWCCAFGNRLQVMSPQSVINQLKDYTQELYGVYHK